MSSIVIVGANGQLGKALQNKYPDALALDSQDLDISNSEQVEDYDWSGVSIILNAAAYTNVDGAESEQELADRVNHLGVANLAQVALKNDSTLAHISSDYVFNGQQVIHTEDEEFSPLSVYGKSKADGDKAAATVPKHYIVRTSWVIGEGKNFVRTMLSLGEKGIAPTVVSDQIGRLTFTTELVRAIDHLLKTNAPYGTYNVSNEGEPASWAEITREVFKDAGYNLNVTGTTTEEYFAGKEGIAPRPLQSTLSLDKIHATGFESHDWKEDLKTYIKAVEGGKS